MRIFRFDSEAGQPIDKYGSVNAVVSRVARLEMEAWINCIHLGAGGILGYHQAVVPQLFLVVEGEGWVRGTSSEQCAITAGHAVFWEAGEWHESGTGSGMTVIVIESSKLDPTGFMLPV